MTGRRAMPITFAFAFLVLGSRRLKAASAITTMPKISICGRQRMVRDRNVVPRKAFNKLALRGVIALIKNAMPQIAHARPSDMGML